VTNGVGQDAAVHHIEKKPKLLNTVKLKLKHSNKTKGSAAASVPILALATYVSECLQIYGYGELNCECADCTESIFVLKCHL
jgi:hypothetical protein